MAKIIQKELWLVGLLQRRPDIPFDSIADAYQQTFGEPLPKSSFRKLVVSLATDMNVQLHCERRGGYLYRLERQGRNVNHTLNELQLASLSLHAILTEAMPERRSIAIDDMPSADERLAAICHAIRDGRSIITRYCPIDKEQYTFELKPYGVRLHLNRWYVVGESLRAEHREVPVRTFSIDRMGDIHPGKRKYRIPRRFDIASYFDGCIGVLSLGEPEMVVLRVTGYQRAYFAELPLHTSQELMESTPDADVYRYSLRCNSELVRAIIEKGREVEVLTPMSLRTMIAAELESILARYDTDTSSTATYIINHNNTFKAGSQTYQDLRSLPNQKDK